MTDLFKPDHDLEEIQEHIDKYADLAADGDEYLNNYVKAHAEIAADEVAIRARSEYLIAELQRETQAMLGDLNRRRRGLDWKHRNPILQLVSARLEGKKARHIKTLYGRVGFRTKPAMKKLVVHDETELRRQWPTIFTLVPKLDRPKLQAMLEAGERCKAGAWLEETEATDTFYIDTGKAELPAPSKALPEKGSDV